MPPKIFDPCPDQCFSPSMSITSTNRFTLISEHINRMFTFLLCHNILCQRIQRHRYCSFCFRLIRIKLINSCTRRSASLCQQKGCKTTPPDNCSPCSPTFVFIPSGSESINFSRCACLIACCISFSVTSGRP